MKRRFYIVFLLFAAFGLFAERPVVELIQPQSLSPTEYGPIEYIGSTGHKWYINWNSCNCTSDIYQTFQLEVHDPDMIDWSTFLICVRTYGGCINTTWWTSEPFVDSTSLAEIIWATQQDYSFEIDTISDTLGIVTITPLGRMGRPDFVCGDSSVYLPYSDSCCLNVGDIYSPGFGHTSAPYWDSPNSIYIHVSDFAGEWGVCACYFCVDYSGPSASRPRPADGVTVDTLHPIIGITILDTIWVRHSAYPDPIDPYFPHCPCGDSTCIDSLGSLLEFPYCGFVQIEKISIDTASIRLSVNGAVYSLDSPGMSWFDDSLLLFDTGEAGLSFADSDTVRVCLEEVTDRVSQGHGPNHLGRHADWTHPDTPVPFCWEFYINTTGIDEATKPQTTGITAIRPNPFNSAVSIEYSVESETRVGIDIYDILGRKIANIENTRRPSGDYRAGWVATDFPGGIYFVRARFGEQEITKRVVYLK